MTWFELVRHYFPGITDEQAGYILWGHTGFPAFWHLTKEYPHPIARCRKQLRELKYKPIRRQTNERNRLSLALYHLDNGE